MEGSCFCLFLLLPSPPNQHACTSMGNPLMTYPRRQEICPLRHGPSPLKGGRFVRPLGLHHLEGGRFAAEFVRRRDCSLSPLSRALIRQRTEVRQQARFLSPPSRPSLLKGVRSARGLFCVSLSARDSCPLQRSRPLVDGYVQAVLSKPTLLTCGVRSVPLSLPASACPIIGLLSRDTLGDYLCRRSRCSELPRTRAAYRVSVLSFLVF